MDDAPQVKVVEVMLQRISNHKGVLGLLVISPRDGTVWKTCAPPGSAFDEKKLAQHAEKIHAFVGLTRSIVRTLDVGNDLMFLRVRSKKYEFIISPDRDYVLIVIQDHHLRLEEAKSLLPSADKRNVVSPKEAEPAAAST
eukprot:TRINITY_DN38090_c0_g1_i1.p2 TRINITY_DN38090_c0_g1~~TRINITY_DN38090_c0_g1_i1.p2  ORF type:complete len:140 (+),score=44.31 TRINITY_DN38090_c0_g1_i1:236-655(+)